MSKIVELWHDPDGQNPADNDGAWTLYSFNRRHLSFKHPDDFRDDGRWSEEIKAKLESGLAFVLDYFEHGGCAWSLRGEGMQDQWDTARGAGLLVWEHDPGDMGAGTVEDRAKDARSFLEEYNHWCNGECYGFTVIEHKKLACGYYEDEAGDSCGGYFDVKCMAEDVREHVTDGDEVTFAGDAKWLVEHYDFIGKKVVE